MYVCRSESVNNNLFATTCSRSEVRQPWTTCLSFTVKAKNYSGASYDQTGSGDTQRSSTSPIEQFTNKLDFRIRGRSFAIRVDSSELGCKYKLGTPQIDIRPDGRR